MRENSQLSAPPTLDAHALREALRSGRSPRLIDVRTPAEFETAHIPGSYSVPLRVLLKLLHEHRRDIVEHLDDDIVLVCRSGQRASTAEQALRESGLSNVQVLSGGITAWQHNGFDVRRGAERWELERQVRLVAGSVVVASILGSIKAPKLKWVAAAFGTGLVTAAVTDTCAMGMGLARLPYNSGAACSAEAVVAQLADARQPAS